jgi:hypothetical protein
MADYKYQITWCYLICINSNKGYFVIASEGRQISLCLKQIASFRLQ